MPIGHDRHIGNQLYSLMWHAYASEFFTTSCFYILHANTPDGDTGDN